MWPGARVRVLPGQFGGERSPMPLRRCSEEGDGGGGDLHRRGGGIGHQIHLRFLQQQWWRGGGCR
jgi:hypothetical protein